MKRLLMTALLLGVLAPVLGAAQGNPAREQGRRGMPPADSMQRNRAMLERQVHQRFAQVLKNQIGATDAQITRVLEINAAFATRRRELLQQERTVRMALRQQINAADTTQQGQVAGLLDRMLAAQRQRIDLLEQEQRELSTVLTPIQRAAYFGLEEQLRLRIEGMGGPGGRGARRGPPPPA